LNLWWKTLKQSIQKRDIWMQSTAEMSTPFADSLFPTDLMVLPKIFWVKQLWFTLANIHTQKYSRLFYNRQILKISVNNNWRTFLPYNYGTNQKGGFIKVRWVWEDIWRTWHKWTISEHWLPYILSFLLESSVLILFICVMSVKWEIFFFT